MQSLSMRVIFTLSAVAFLCFSTPCAEADTATSRMVSAAGKFLGTLDAKQRKTVVYAFNDEKQRKRWSNLPVAMVPRGGLRQKEKKTEQRTATMAVVAAVLSSRGFEKIQQ